MQTPEVPVDTPAQGALRTIECGKGEALLSCGPNTTGVSGGSPVACATRGRIVPAISDGRTRSAISPNRPFAAWPSQHLTGGAYHRAGPDQQIDLS